LPGATPSLNADHIRGLTFSPVCSLAGFFPFWENSFHSWPLYQQNGKGYGVFGI